MASLPNPKPFSSKPLMTLLLQTQNPKKKKEEEEEEDDGNDETPHHAKKPSVTFFEPESNEVGVVHEGIDESEEVSVSMRPKIERLKKGECYRCRKGNRFVEKEVCIVCGASYCYDCVLRAMGSMPEGRKCVTCIGFRIREARRGKLGKCSRLLKRLLTDSEVKIIMNVEMLCEVNQVPPELVVVNGETLSQDELFRLKHCKFPPKKLGPGYYWYDKSAGFWGKEGQKPSQIITCHLDVGGHIKRNASNGNTNVLINGREITKEELWMLKSAGVYCEEEAPCEGKPHYFWVSEDGTCQEEQQMNEKGKIWDKTRTKLVCEFLSLPVPPGPENPSQKEVNGEIRDNLAQKSIRKFLLVGYDKFCTSTIYKQAKFLYGIPFSEDERQTIKFLIQRNLFGYLGVLLEGRERFEEESLLEKRKRCVVDKCGPSGDTIQIDDTTIYSIGTRVRAISDWLLQVLLSDNLEAVFPAASCEYASFIEEMWKDAAIQATYNRRNELQMLPRVATYFLDRAVEISRTDYEPSDMDILYADGITSSDSLTCMDFSFPKSTQHDRLDPPYRHARLLRYQLIRVHPRKLGEHCKWLDMFEDTDIVLFCVSMTDYDEYSADCNGVLTNKMLASKHLFESMVTHPTFENKNFLLILNKFDLLKEKIEQVPLSQCEWFRDFKPIVSQNCYNSTNHWLATRAFHYIRMKFKTIFNSLTDKKLFVSLVTELENDTVDEALRYAREIIKWDKTRTKLVCAVLSLPVPPGPENPSRKEVNGEIQDNLAQKSIRKFLLVGCDKSGTSTIYKQAKFLYGIPFSEDERQTIKLLIQRNFFGYLGVLLEGRERFEEESLLEKRKRCVVDKSGPSGDTIQIDDTTIYSVGARVRAFSDWLLQVLLSDNLEAIFPVATCEYAPFIKEMWMDTAIQATYKRRNELQMLPRLATYFLDRAVEISRTDYEPSDMDILYADGITSSNSLTCMEFSFPKSTQDDRLGLDYWYYCSLRYQLIRVHPRSLGEHCKWLDMFEDTDIVLFCVSMTDYDEYSADCNGVLTNKMLASKHLFETMVTHPTFENKKFLLILNKFDLLEEKIEQVPLSQCEWFHDFKPIVRQNRRNSTDPSLAQHAFRYIGMKFKTLFNSLTDKKLFVSLVTGLENDKVDEALRYAREIIMWQ